MWHRQMMRRCRVRVLATASMNPVQARDLRPCCLAPVIPSAGFLCTIMPEQTTSEQERPGCHHASCCRRIIGRHQVHRRRAQHYNCERSTGLHGTHCASSFRSLQLKHLPRTLSLLTFETWFVSAQIDARLYCLLPFFSLPQYKK